MLARPSLRLPAGMRDFAPDAAMARRRIAGALLGVFERWGFARVITPAFEYEDVLALGLGTAARAAAIRFVEPSSGQVVALPPDITPQIARLIATRYADEPGPVRLCYEGSVVRLDPRARAQREIIQAGVELAGVASTAADAEVIALGAEALFAAGLEGATISVGHLGLVSEVFTALRLPESAVVSARARIARRDRAGLRDVLRSAGGHRNVVAFAESLSETRGSPAVLEQARRQAPTPGIRAALDNLIQILARLHKMKIPARLQVDLGEVRGFDYYTGVRFGGYVHGAAEPVLAGGRYDGLLAKYGCPSPAVGFAIDVEESTAALEDGVMAAAASSSTRGKKSAMSAHAGYDGGVLVSGPPEQAQRVAADLRRKGRRAAVDLGGLSAKNLDAHARRWHFADVVRLKKPNSKR